MHAFFKGKKILSTHDLTKGADQKVELINTTRGSYIRKKQKANSNNHLRELFGRRLAQKVGIQVPKILYAQNYTIIEEYIEGRKPKPMDFMQVGRSIRSLHKVKSYGSGEVVGPRGATQYASAKVDVKKWCDHIVIPQAKQYVQDNINILNDIQQVYLHGDLHAENIIMQGGPVFIDWADTRAGPKEQELANVYAHESLASFKHFIRGYGSYNQSVFKLYASLYCGWLNKKKKFSMLHKES